MKLLSILIPTYNRNESLIKLLQRLQPQIQDEVEVIVIDDHSDNQLKLEFPSWLKYIVLEENSGGASIPRNVGLDNAKGQYITFIDSDDDVSLDYVKVILDKIKSSEFDYCYISWKCSTHSVIIKDEPPSWNCCVWNCIYKRDLIGDIRFRKDLIMAEDYDFNARVRKGKRANIVDILYYYNDETPNSLTKQGKLYNEKYSGGGINEVI